MIIDEYYYLLFADLQSLTWSDRPHPIDLVQLDDVHKRNKTKQKFHVRNLLYYSSTATFVL